MRGIVTDMFDKRYIDKAFINGKVVTVNENNDFAEAVGTKGNKIVYVGSTEELMDLTDSETEIIDLDGKVLMPKLIDTHVHPILNGFFGDEVTSSIINLGKIKSIKEMLELFSKAVNSKKAGEWISSMGYEQAFLEEKRHPTLEELDKISSKNPLQCMHVSGHICVYNSLALQSIGVYGPEDASKYPENEIEVKDGKLTGMVKDHTHFKIWKNVAYTIEEQKAAALKSQKQFLSNGITSVHDCGECDAPSYHIMRKLCDSREFVVREYMCLHSIFGKPISLEDNEYWVKLGMMTGLGDEHFKIGTSKFMIDGGSGAPSSACREPYSHDHELPGICGWEREEVAKYIKMLNDAECQISSHAMGDLAIEYMVEGYEYAFKTSKRPDLRHRIEHCMLVDQNLIDRMAKMNICPTVNSGMLSFNGRKYNTIYGEKRSKYIMALRSMLDAGMKPSIASDSPSGPMGFAVIDGVVNRYDRRTDYQFDKTQAITLTEAIRCATINGAYASYEEKIKGSIEEGKLADMIILDRDIFSIDPMKLYETQVEKTYIDGELAYEK